MGDAIARGVVTSPLVTSSPATPGVTSGKIAGPPGNGAAPIVDAISIEFYKLCEFETNPTGISGGIWIDTWWSPDGTKVYVMRDSTNQIEQDNVDPAYSLLAADWSGFGQISFTDPRAIWWTPDGSRVFTLPGNGVFSQSDASVAFDLTSLTGAGSRSLSSGQLDVYFSEDGLRLWVYSSANPTNSIRELALTSAYDVTTINLTAVKTKSFAGDFSNANAFVFSDDGLELYLITPTLGGSAGQLSSYTLSTPFDIDTAGPFTQGPAILPTNRMSIPRGLCYRHTDGALFVNGDQGVGNQRVQFYCPEKDPDITDYSLTTAAGTFTISGNNHNTPYFNLAGTRCYFDRTTSQETWQYNMSTPGDMSTITFGLTHNWPGFENQLQRAISLTPKTNDKFYKIRRVSGTNDFFLSADPFDLTEVGDDAGGNPYTLTGVSTAGSIATTPATPTAFVVAANNLDLFVMSGDALDKEIYHYQMSILGDAGSATLQGSALDVSSEFDTLLRSIVYTPDGSKLFVVGEDGGATIIAQYDMSTAYDVNTAVYSGKQLTVTPASNTLLGLFVWENPLGGFQLNLTWPVGGASNGTAWAFDQYDAP